MADKTAFRPTMGGLGALPSRIPDGQTREGGYTRDETEGARSVPHRGERWAAAPAGTGRGQGSDSSSDGAEGLRQVWAGITAPQVPQQTCFGRGGRVWWQDSKEENQRCKPVYSETGPIHECPARGYRRGQETGSRARQDSCQNQGSQGADLCQTDTRADREGDSARQARCIGVPRRDLALRHERCPPYSLQTE